MFGFFKGGAGKGGKEGGDGSAPDAFHSVAADALAAAVDHSSSTAAKAGPQPTGRRLKGAASISIDLDALQPREAVAELQVQPITLLKSDYKLAHTQQVAVSNTFICYGLKAGHIRALNRNTADRALFKGHPAAVSHMAFFSPSTPLLASASCKGDLTVRQVAAAPGEGGAEGTITGDVLLTAQLPLPAGADAAPDGARVTLAWHPVMSQILAAAAGSGVFIYEVPTTAPGGDAPPPPASPGIRYAIAGGASVSAVAFSPTGDLLAAGDSGGGVRVWWMEGDEDTADAPALAWQPFGGNGSIGSVHFLHQAGDGSSLLLTGDATNSSLKLWALPSAAAATAAGGGQQPQCLQSVSFVGSAGGAATPFFCHVAVQLELQVVVLANTARKQVYTLHYGLGDDGGVGDAAFDYAAFFSVKQPILSLDTLLEAAEASGAGAAGQQQAVAAAQGQQLMLYCVQTEAIQQYTINPALCMAGAGAEEEEAAEQVGSSSDAAAAGAAASSVSTAAAAAAEPQGSSSPAPAAAVPPPAKLPTPTFLGSRAKAAQKAAAAAASPDKGAAASHAAKAAADADNKKQQQAQAEVAPPPESVASDASDSTAAVQAAVDSVEDVAAAAAASPLPPLPTTSLMHSAEKVPAPAAAGADGAVAAAAAGAALAAVAGGAAAAAAGTAAGSGEPAGLQQQMQQLLAMQQQMAAQLHAATQQTVAGVKAEVGKALKASEGSMLKQIEAAIKAAAKKAEEERRKGAAKERQELEKAMAAQLTQTSALLQRDLARVLGDAAREQGRTMVNAIVTSVTPVVASAVAASMQQELAAAAAPGGSLAVALEGSLASSLARPLHEALKANFDVSLIPAFERATQAMFLQVEGAFNNWMAESSGAVAATQAEAASSLSNSLAQLQALVGTMRSELADTSRSLSRMASSAASRGPGGDGGSGAAAAAAGGGGSGADPRAEITALLASRNYDSALARALNTASPDTLLWVCKQLDPAQVLGGTTSSLSQTTLLSLVNQLSVNLRADADAPVKLAWLAEAGPVIDPHDRLTAPHMQGVLTGVLNALKALVTSLPPSDGMAKKGKITLHLFNSLLHQ